MIQPARRLAAHHVSKRFGSHVALDAVSLAVDAGECVALVGESGSGKTTLLRLFNALVRPDSGRVEIDGDDVATADGVALRRRIGYVPQEGGLLPHWRVQRNVELVPWLREVPAYERADAARRALALAFVAPAYIPISPTNTLRPFVRAQSTVTLTRSRETVLETIDVLAPPALASAYE